VDRILLGHGSGGTLMHELIASHFAPAFGMEGLLSDAAVLEAKAAGRLAVCTDSYVVSPLFFPGGNIGELAVNGTVNDLSMVGAEPLYLTAGFIIEEGFAFEDLERIVGAMAEAASEAGVRIVAGDTKVVERGKGDGVFINTAGVGAVPEGVELGPSRVRAGDRIILSGPVGSHGMAVMAERNGLSFDPPVLSDTAPLNAMARDILGRPDGVCLMRDPTRGGLATTLSEFARETGLCMSISEELVTVAPGVRGACELLGLDPLYVANEGVLVAVVRGDMPEYYIEAMRGHPAGRAAAIVGEVETGPAGSVLLRTVIGGTRVLQMLQGEQLPRIC
jgi:hydrogenase expression/formation protein HypE